MASTPPPRERIRVRTPPTPLHGARFDGYEPYSPRRSRRVASQRAPGYSLDEPEVTTKHPSASSKKRATSLLGLDNRTPSPPSSPKSPAKRSTAKKLNFTSESEVDRPDSDIDAIVRKPSALDPFASRTSGMLPTPSKTPAKPSKHLAEPSSAFGSTARVLFQSRPATVDEVMPSPRKSRKKHSAFSLFSFADECDDNRRTSKIEIYTDSKERVPSKDNTVDNPFVTRDADEQRASRPRRKTRSSRKRTESEEDMERKAENDEGLIYTFRGKKVFRAFNNSSDEESPSDDDGPLESARARRHSGATSRRPLTRSTIKPRLLFPTDEQRKAREIAAAAAEEEATTDVEGPARKPTPRKRFSVTSGPHVPAIEQHKTQPEAAPFASVPQITTTAATPAKQRFRDIGPTTPPPSGRATRSTAKKEAEAAAVHDALDVDEGEEDAPSPSKTRESPAKPKKKRSPFDNWRRSKSSLPSSRGSPNRLKRRGETLEKTEQHKRTRSLNLAPTQAHDSTSQQQQHSPGGDSV
ncbi:uncharacterized protein K452DRAFT_306078 [Aplosporella prunicola CBS 121167]|uniref:Uncharacterized protein n=1 Tax=Aplosporella prunicola CBS 121167 TaxID=1176127 RepID=A0A6A6BM82_9PEZI|nr:uncharacterized protein K452DRAFT_306078 [Aplosporella prunicola CBS 121167]KAF2145156.1 hypothetical protein K452DRAFT_306078 [Aplosporella prunicola CBS 121167]